jgi:Ser/Thr protein kinase RdoA (MazF antagonist)
MNFNQRSRDQQLAAFESAAREALARWDLPDAFLRLIALRSNAVFAAEICADRYILRVNWPERKSLAFVRSEAAWTSDLHRRGLPVAHALREPEVITLDGVPPLICTLIAYLDGEQIPGLDFTPAHAAATGRLMAQLHTAGQDFTPPPDFDRFRLDFDGLFGARSIYALDSGGEALLAPHRPVLDAVTSRVADIFSRLDAESDAFGLIHGDLKPDNMLFAASDQPRLLDFDDCGWGYFLYEFAPLLLFVRPPNSPVQSNMLNVTDNPATNLPSPRLRGRGVEGVRGHYQALKSAAWQGYTSVRPLPDWQFDALETLVAGRFAASCLWVASHHDHPAYRDSAPAILAERATRLAAFLETGML